MSKIGKRKQLNPQVEMSEWLSPAQAARMLGVTTSRIRQLSLAGHLHFEQTPMGRIYRRSEIERLAASRPTRTDREDERPGGGPDVPDTRR